jgi:ABC-type lipoprotein export system ATPase subunit
MKTNGIFLKAEGIRKTYRIGKKGIQVLRGVDLEIPRGTWTSLLGASGSGKTTLLNILGTLECPDAGKITCDGVDFGSLSARQASKFRNKRIGFIFQAYHMMPELTILENVMLAAQLNGSAPHDLRRRAESLLEKVGLSDRVKHRPTELSGGEQQRAAIARALINSPDLILADEPTGNLDSKTGSGILEIFQALHQSQNAPTIIMITHNQAVADLGDRTLHLVDGRIADSASGD